MNKNDPINEAAICQRRLATLATREARAVAKVRERYSAKRAAITEGLSPAAQRVLAAAAADDAEQTAALDAMDASADAAKERLETTYVVLSGKETLASIDPTPPPSDAVSPYELPEDHPLRQPFKPKHMKGAT